MLLFASAWTVTPVSAPSINKLTVLPASAVPLIAGVLLLIDPEVVMTGVALLMYLHLYQLSWMMYFLQHLSH